MSRINQIQKIYFIGIGGIGMSALARYFHSKNVVVSGYDKTQTQLTKALEDSGIAIHYHEDVDSIPKDVDAVVYTPAMPANHAELMYYQTNGYTVVKRSDVLQWISESSFNICIAGTHGKTTTTSMIAHILRHTGYGCNAFLGGIAANYNTNFWSSENNVVVVEADEYDRSFLKLSPDIAIITSMDADHLDIYGTAEEVENAFIQFSQKVKPGGCLITKYGLARASEFEVPDHCTYSLNDSLADVHVSNLIVVNGSYQFDVMNQYWKVDNVVLHMGGLHNIENAIVAISVAKYLKIDNEKIKAAVADFKGVKRRFEYLLKTEKHVLIDDYAHHPTELEALISGVRSLFAGKKLTLVFQPHLFSRTNDLADEFAVSLSKADEVILLPIYPARELPMAGVTSELILNKMTLVDKQVLAKEAMLEWIQVNKPELVVMAGAGDIDTLLQPVKKILTTD
ncbi:UDP-N-acetylmuramate--L-alanine ligase [Parasediminibacterium paludis]|uniref:UDP-N-acetylmuramate--L-alanine ligase n=1 Tax=Parasediminibacterium paludis TaxID=908966 RepID=A0ABV8PXS8_9BACT